MSFKITLVCSGIDASAAAIAAQDIEAEFSDHRRWWNTEVAVARAFAEKQAAEAALADSIAREKVAAELAAQKQAITTETRDKNAAQSR